jgi:hypothetical protein
LARKSIFGVLLALLCAMSMWFYVDRVLIAHQRSDAAVLGRPRGNLSDLYPRWLGSRELLLRHRNPYSAEVTREIQRGYYGRELDPRRPGDPIDQQAFAYPTYVAFLLAPTIRLPFEAVRNGFIWLLLAITAASVWFWLHAFGWVPRLYAASTIALLTLGSFPVVQGLKLQQLTLLVAFIIAMSTALLAKGKLFLAGIAMAIATIKPQLVAPLLLCLMLWAFRDWARRQRFVWGFALTLLALSAAAQVVLPGWIGHFLSALRAYRQYAGGKSLLDELLSPAVGQVTAAGVLVLLLVVCWRFRQSSASSREFQYLLAAVLGTTVVVIPMFAPYNQILLLPVVLVLLRECRDLWNRNFLSKGASLLAALVIGWPWVAAMALTITSLWVSPPTLQRAWMVPLYTTFALPFALLIPLGSLLLDVWGKQATPLVFADVADARPPQPRTKQP